MRWAARLRVPFLVSMVMVACGGAVRSSSPDDPDPPTNGGSRFSDPGPPIATGTGGSATPVGPVGTGGAASTIGTAGRASSGKGGSSTLPVGTGGTSTIGAGGEVGEEPRVRCTAPYYDPPTGLVSCGEGFVHRPVVVLCEGTNLGWGGAGGEPGEAAAGAGGEPASACLSDGDCSLHEVCACNIGPPGGTCVPSDCRTDADCGFGLCASFTPICGGAYRFSCVSPDDKCAQTGSCGAPCGSR